MDKDIEVELIEIDGNYIITITEDGEYIKVRDTNGN